MASSMYRRAHHQRIARLLADLDRRLLEDARCFFAGGTAITLQLNEYRESVDVDFLCADAAGYRRLREAVFEKGIQGVFSAPVTPVREARADQYGIRAVVPVNGTPVKIEIVREDRLMLHSTAVPGIPVPCLCQEDLFVTKLLANTDRYADRSALGRDIIDLSAMEHYWGPVPPRAWEKAGNAYGRAPVKAYEKARALFGDNPRLLSECLSKLAVEDEALDWIKGSFRP